MTDHELHKILKEKIEQGDCFNKQIQAILLDYKISGGQQQTAKEMIEQLAVGYSNDEVLQDRTYDILDILTGWCNTDMLVWEEYQAEIITDGLRFEDAESGVIFNHFSFCELVKNIMVTYGKIDYATASDLVNNSYLAKTPRSIDSVGLLTHELEFHWAMLFVHGEMYWTKGIPSDYNQFKDEYLAWETEIKRKYNLKESYEYYDKP